MLSALLIKENMFAAIKLKKGDNKMQKEFTKFTALIGQEQQKEKTLIQNIKDSKEQISNLEDEYNQALSNDDDKKADELQQAIEGLKRSLKRNEDRLGLLTGYDSNEDLIKQADNVLAEAIEEIDKRSTEAFKLGNEYKKLRTQLIDKAFEISEYKKMHSKNKYQEGSRTCC